MSDLLQQATVFIQQFHRETQKTGLAERLAAIQSEIANTGTYEHTFAELEYGAKVAWRNSNRCIGRLFWNSLKVHDYRHISREQEIFTALKEHLEMATNAGKIRSVISIFPAKNTAKNIHWRIHNYSLLQYAGYQNQQQIIGDPKHVNFTQQATQLGWQSAQTDFDLLPVIIQNHTNPPQCFEFSAADVLEVKIEHPHFNWFADLNLKWYAVPVISNMILRIGGLEYTAAPFNGWYMLNEIACRNFGDTDRYNLLPKVAQRMGLDTTQRVGLWKDRAMVELNEAVLYSFTKAGLSIVDHHSAAEQFMQFNERECQRGRDVNADWAWIAPPMSPSATPVYHQEWQNEIVDPNFYYREEEFPTVTNRKVSRCPIHQN